MGEKDCCGLPKAVVQFMANFLTVLCISHLGHAWLHLESVDLPRVTAADDNLHSNAQTLTPQVQDRSEASLSGETEGFEVCAVEMLPWIYRQGL